MNTAGRDLTWAERMLLPGAAVIVDYETTALDGAVCEVAVIAADTGHVLVNTLIDPLIPITAEAHRVHGITDADVAGAPRFVDVLPRLEAAIEGRIALAYNAAYELEISAWECERLGVSSPLADETSWDCIMIERQRFLRSRRRIRLGAAHRALGDTRAALDVIHQMVRTEATSAA